MTESAFGVPADLWSEWVLGRRHGGDAGYQRVVQAEIAAIADRVIDGARLSTGMTLLDAGTGEGLLVWRAIERIGPGLQVILTDVSLPLLAHAREQAERRGFSAQCRFEQAALEQLAGIASASVDAVTSRAVLAYVADKPAALREALRVLKPGGWLSLAEPVLRDEALRTLALRQHLEAPSAGSGPPDAFMGLMLRWRAAQYPSTPEQLAASPITNYTERDLMRWAQEAGYAEIHLELHVDVRPSRVPSWEVFTAQSPHPWAPSLRSLLAQQFSPAEAALMEQVLRPAIEGGLAMTTDAIAYLRARKPALSKAPAGAA